MMNQSVEAFYKKATFPISVEKLFLPRQGSIIDTENNFSFVSSDHKVITRLSEDGKNEKVISVMSETYEPYTNQQTLDKALDAFEAMKLNYQIDSTHSMLTDSRMHLALNFPEYEFDDGTGSNVQYQVRIHNSYDGSERVRLIFGFIRMVCTNGMISMSLGEVLMHKHSKGINNNIDVYELINKAFNKVPKLQAKIDEMNNTIVSMELFKKSVEAIGLRNAENIGLGENFQKRNGESKFNFNESILKLTQYDLLNKITYLISHDIEMKHRFRMQQSIAKAFKI